ncbi:MAG: hypothetical protein HC873_23170 [Leptolyngbyaceae cyanobacterium SL_1_1]|nr:hypothetical protein [Leptolyngbyaceae cyanobacterium SL_1_1]
MLVSWKVSIELNNAIAAEEQELLMALSQAYLEWEQQTKQQWLEQGLE